MYRAPKRTQAGMADWRFFDPQSERKPLGSNAQYRERSGGNFGSDTVTGKNEEIHFGEFQWRCGAIFSNFAGKKSRITGHLGRIIAGQSACLFPRSGAA